MVYDLNTDFVKPFTDKGCTSAKPAEMMRLCDLVITCLPSPAASTAVVTEMIPEMKEGKTWVEMSTTDEEELKRLADLIAQTGGTVAECPVSGGCHRAATGNISIFAGCDRPTFDRILPLLTFLGRKVLHTGPIGTASMLKVMTNYLATVNLVSCCEAMTTMKAHDIDMATCYEAIAISSGTSFVHETESQLILSGSRDVHFTMDLILKDIGLFQKLADKKEVPLEISPLVIEIMKDGQKRYGEKGQTDRIIERLEDATGLSVLAEGFPTDLEDDEPEQRGYEVKPRGA